MGEKSLQENNGAQIARDEKEISRLVRSLAYRNPFEGLVFQMLGVAEDLDRLPGYSKLIGEYIDKEENTEIRDFIIQKKFQEAAEMMVAEIRREEEENSLKRAA